MTIRAAAPSIADERLSSQVLDSFADAEPLRSGWDELVLRAGADVYQTFDWCRLWWRHYGAGRQLQLLLYFRGEELVGLVPAFIETLWLGPIRVRAAKLVGTDFTLNLCNLPVLANVLSLVVSHSIRHFFGKHHCDVVLFGPLSGPTARLDELVMASENEKESGIAESVQTLGNSCNTYFQMPDTFAQYLKDIGKQQRGNFNRGVTQFCGAHKVSFDVVSEGDKVNSEFEGFCRLHASQWGAEGKLGHFGDWPNAQSFNRDLICTLGKKGMVRFHRILANDHVVSSQYTFAYGGTNYWRLPARVSGPEWDRFSLGRIGLLKMIESSMSEGQQTIEAGRGHYTYKVQLGGREWPLRTIQMVRRGRGVSARVRMFRALALLLDVAYYKVVCARVAPRLPAFRRPLWPIWIRSTW